MINMGTTRDLTKSDTAGEQFNMILVSIAGSLIIDQVGGNTVTLTDVPANVWIPVGRATNVQTGSTALGLMVV